MDENDLIRSSKELEGNPITDHAYESVVVAVVDKALAPFGRRERS